MNRKILFALCAVFFLSHFYFPSYAADGQPTVRISIPEDESLAIERILNFALSGMGYVAEPSHNLRRTAVVETDTGDTDIVGLFPEGIEEMYPNLARVPFALSYSTFRAYSRDINTGAYGSWDSLAGLNVGYLPMNVYLPIRIPASCAVTQYKNETELWQGLASGEVDVAVLPEFETVPRATPRGFRIAGTLELAQTYPYVHKNSAELIQPLTEALENLEASGMTADIKNGLKPNVSDRRRVVHITSYNLDSIWEAQITEGIRAGLQLKDNETVDTFQLNTRHVTDKYTQRRNTALSIRNTFLNSHPDVVLVSDNDALEFVAQYYHTLFVNIPVIFCGVNNFSEEMVTNIDDVALGCTESISAIATVEEMLRLYPNTERIFILNDYVTSGIVWRQDIERQLARLNPNVEIVYNGNVTHEENIARAESYGSETLILLGSYFTDSENEFWAEDETQRRFAETTDNPVFSLISSFTGAGSLGGMVSSGFNQGEYAGGLARRILDGATIGSLSIYLSTETINEWIFDVDVMKKFGLKENQLPDGARFMNFEEYIWDTNPVMFVSQMAVLGLILTAVIVLLFILKREKRKVKLLKNEMAGMAEYPLSVSVVNTAEWIAKALSKTPVIFIAEMNGKIAVINDYAREQLQINPGDSMGAVFKSHELHSAMKQKLKFENIVSNETIPILMPNGETHRHRTTFSVIRHERDSNIGYLLLASDIEKDEQTQEYISRTNNDMQKIVDTLPMAMAVLNAANSKLEYANTRFLSLLNCKNLYDAPANQVEELSRQIYARWQGVTVQFEYESNFRLYANQIVFKNQNCFVIIGQDISAETRRAELLSRAADKEREANQLKSLFLANMSHEIRTPMNAILGLSQTALMKEQTPENAGIYQKIGSATKTLLSIINDILDFSKIEAEKLVIVEEDFLLEETIANVFLVATEHAEDKPIEILLDAAPGVPAALRGDKSRLWQILKNLLDNSVKYTKAGHVILGISALNVTDGSVTLKFTVKDTGVGMTKDQVERLFAPFEQFHRNVTKAAGTGLGMSITHNLVQLLNGTINVTSEVDAGTVFEVELPFKLPPGTKNIFENALSALPAKPDPSRMVLIVDDDRNACTAMANIVSEIGLEFACALDLESALMGDENICQIAVVDYNLGGSAAGGREAAQKISGHYKNIKIFFSASSKGQTVAEEDSVCGVIEKPFTVSDFLGKLFGKEKGTGMVAAQERSLSFPNARVLLVEDNEINQLVVTSILENFDVFPRIANNGLEALEILETQEFDVVYMDISMPVMDGHAAAARIRGGGKPYKNVPIVAMTANVMPEEVAQYMAEGMDGFLEKPIDLGAFQASLVKFLSK